VGSRFCVCRCLDLSGSHRVVQVRRLDVGKESEVTPLTIARAITFEYPHATVQWLRTAITVELIARGHKPNDAWLEAAGALSELAESPSQEVAEVVTQVPEDEGGEMGVLH